MQKTISIIFRKAGFCLVILILLALLTACGGSTTTSGSTNPTATATTANSVPTSSTLTQTPATTSPSGNASGVSIANFSFSPATLTISKGTKVTWTNNDSVTHTVTADQGAWDSNGLTPGSTFNFTFTNAGTYT